MVVDIYTASTLAASNAPHKPILGPAGMPISIFTPELIIFDHPVLRRAATFQ